MARRLRIVYPGALYHVINCGNYLRELAADPTEQERQGFSRFSRHWAIGTPSWRRALAESYAQHSLDPGIPVDEL